MSIDVTTTEQQITASVSGGTVAVGVSGGVGPTGSQGPSGVVAVTAPITNSGSSTSANLGLSVGSGLQVAGGALAVAFTSTAFTSAVVAAAPAGGGLADAPSDGTFYARKDAAWVDITSPANLQIRRGLAAEVAAITPMVGEPVWATDTKVLSVGDGTTAGGIIAGYPVRISHATGNGPLSTLTDPIPRTPVTLSPQGSVWEFFWMTHLGLSGSEYADNASMLFTPATTNTTGMIGEFLFLNSNGSPKHFRLDGSSAVECTVTGLGEYMSAKGIVSVSAASATLAFHITPSDVQVGDQGGPAICIARRIA